MQWKVNSERSLYRDQWVDVRSVDVELPDGRHLDHRMIHTSASAGAVVVNDSGRVLLLWRHRFSTDTWGYEIPLGRIRSGEAPIEAAAREVEDQSGWRPGTMTSLLYVQPSAGADHVPAPRLPRHPGHLRRAGGGQLRVRVRGMGPAGARARAHRQGQIVSGTTVAALLMAVVSK
jgi:hypothetical protein